MSLNLPSDGGRVWFGPADSEWMGTDDDGVPVLADQDGAGPMQEITGITDVRLEGDAE